MSASFILLLEGVVNRALRLDPDSLARLGEHEGKVIRLQIAGAGNREIFVHPSAMGLRLSEQHDAAADVTLAGNIPVFMRFALRAAIPGVAATGEIQISGDIALGQRFQSVLEKIDIDWEEQAARVLGDVAAHHLGNAVRDLRGWSRQSRQTLCDDAAEYLQEESRLLPLWSRAENFRRAVDALRLDADSLEKRFQRLHEQTS